MEIIIKGDPKEISNLLIDIQERQEKCTQECASIDKIIHSLADGLGTVANPTLEASIS